MTIKKSILILALAVLSMSCSRSTKKEIRILSFNVHACSPKDSYKADYDGVAKYIVECGADVVALQELDSKNMRHLDDQIEELASRSGMKGHFTKSIDYKDGDYGIGMLFRNDPLSIDELSLPGKEPRSLLCVEFDEAIYISTHLCLHSENQIASAKIICHYADSISVKGKPIFLAGDFNVELSDQNFSDVMSQHWTTISGDDLTFPNDKPKLRIDFIMMYKGSMANNVEVVGNGIYRSDKIDVARLSDHLPIYTDIVM